MSEGPEKRARTTARAAGEVVSERTITVPHTAYSIAGTLTATLGNVLQPIFPIVWISAAVFGAILGGVFLLKRAGKPVMTGVAGFAIMGFLVSTFLLLVQYAPASANSSDLKKEAGAVAASVPGLLTVQNALLPIDELQKDSNRFRLAVTRGEEEDRGIAARAMLDAASDPSVSTALLSIALKGDVPSVRQAGLVRVLDQRKGAQLPITITDVRNAPTIEALFKGAQFAISKIDVNTGIATGILSCATARRPFDGVAAGGSLTITGPCYDRTSRTWKTYRLVLTPNPRLGLSGAITLDDETASVAIPIL